MIKSQWSVMKDDVAEIFNPLSVDYTFRPLSHKHKQTTDRLLGCWAPAARWSHTVTSYSIMQEPERKLSEPSVWEHPPDWQGVPSTLCKCTLSRTHSPSAIFPYPQCSWKSRCFKRMFGRLLCRMLVWILEDSLPFLHHCQCTVFLN